MIKRSYGFFIKTPKNIFSCNVSQYDKKSAYTMSLNVFEVQETVLWYQKIRDEVISQLFEGLTTKPIKGGSKCIDSKLKKRIKTKKRTWKGRIKTNFHGRDVPYDVYCNAKAVLNCWICIQTRQKLPPLGICSRV